ncbi:MAG: AAA family ATPase [Rothia sp. (in: high G+C Gram-positive bacteria)]|uniref:AAA family ATPase n=1 Tax=Rothia sp. (in: high G+C Gram-positive bacteria) TaxID=1885016 RepID=UPI0026E0268F|nr:AAA family ATPase [Rothia sp. (in: high G+C Gram-positive bacteria)]MDO5750123.1 AAA family ATPase [Rothia sp. (in: high G+C Gram-positive bacteria)]
MSNTAVILYRDDGTLLNAIERKHGALSVARHAEELSEALGAAHTGIARALILCVEDRAITASVCSSLAASGVKTIAASGGYAAIPGLWRITPSTDIARMLEEIETIIARPEVLAPAPERLSVSAAAYAPAAGGYGFDLADSAQGSVRGSAQVRAQTQAAARRTMNASSAPISAAPAHSQPVQNISVQNTSAQSVPTQSQPNPLAQGAPATRATVPSPSAAPAPSAASNAPLVMTAPIKLPAGTPAPNLNPKITVQSATGVPNLPPPARTVQTPVNTVQAPANTIQAPAQTAVPRALAPAAAIQAQAVPRAAGPQPVNSTAQSPTPEKSKRSKRTSKTPKTSRKPKTHNMGLDILRPAAPSPEDYREQNPGKGSVITIWGTEGAPGRSTVAINLAAHAAKCGHRVCVIDADTYAPSLSALLYMEHEHAGLSQLCRAAERGLLDEHALARAAQRIPVNTFHFDLISGVVQAERWHEVRESAFRAVLEYLRLYYEVIIVDIAPSIEHEDDGFDMPAPRRNGASIVALEEAAQILLLGVANPIGVPRAVRAWQRLHSSGHNISPTVECSVWLTKMHADISRFSAKDEIRRAWAAFSGEDAPEPQFIGYDHRALSKAIERGQLVMQAAPRSRFARDMEAMYKSLSLVHYS